LLSEFPTKVAHTLLRTLDANMDSMVSRDEWRRGWAGGMLTTVLLKEHDKAERKEPGRRMSSRREGGVMALTAATAARNAALAAEAAANKGKKNKK
jgi:hypothetical protein